MQHFPINSTEKMLVQRRLLNDTFCKEKDIFYTLHLPNLWIPKSIPICIKTNKKIELNQSKVLSLADLNQQVFLDALIQESVKMNTIAKSDKEVNWKNVKCDNAKLTCWCIFWC